MSRESERKAIIEKIGSLLKELSVPPPEELPDQIKDLLEQLKRK